MSANYSLVLSLQWGLDHERVKYIGLLAIKLVMVLVARAFSQLRSLSIEMILGLGIGEVVWPD